MEISNKEICWVDPITNEFLETKNHFLVSKSSSYSILDGIPNFVNTVNDKMQKQVQESFGEKWTQNDKLSSKRFFPRPRVAAIIFSIDGYYIPRHTKKTRVKKTHFILEINSLKVEDIPQNLPKFVSCPGFSKDFLIFLTKSL